ncbi:MAG: hypothetical protein HY666_06040 [Chloroflexi bacterium]|nr:hypothetical protein [Chloroflexota bacterium]
MTGEIVRGKFVGVTQGPAMILEVKGEERSFPLSIDLSLDWIQSHMDTNVMVMLRDGQVVEVM